MPTILSTCLISGEKRERLLICRDCRATVYVVTSPFSCSECGCNEVISDEPVDSPEILCMIPTGLVCGKCGSETAPSSICTHCGSSEKMRSYRP